MSTWKKPTGINKACDYRYTRKTSGENARSFFVLKAVSCEKTYAACPTNRFRSKTRQAKWLWSAISGTSFA
ncbi:hypothetical protein CRH03_11005 [Clostridium sp. HMb25]|nr:hypothetical protein CRH03_11005 [Clostridium sp. HMb25]